jgi:hypothetical protein
MEAPPHKRTMAVADQLAALNCDPLAALVTIAQDEKIDISLRVAILRDFLTYLYPRRKAVDLTGGYDRPMKVTLNISSNYD